MQATYTALVALTLLASCRGSSERQPIPVVLDDGGVIPPGDHLDPFVELARGPGSTFVEIAEVRARDDGTVLYCSGVKGLIVLDASDPTDMFATAKLASRLGDSVYPRCQHLSWSGDEVYFTSRGDEFQRAPFVSAWDMSGIQPVEVATYTEEPLSFEGIAAKDQYLFVAAHGDGLIVLQRLDDSLVRRGQLSAGLVNAWAVAVAGDTLYVADGVGGLAVVDVSNPDAPLLLGSVVTGGSAQSVELDPDTSVAWVAAGAAGLVAVDVSDPATPVVIGRYDSPGSALQVALSNGHAFLADWNDVRVVDISQANAPRLVATERVATSSSFPRVLGIGASGNYAFLGEWTGLYSFELHPDRTAPDLWIETRSVEFGSVDPGAADAEAVLVENQGTERLVLWTAAVTGSGKSAFSLDKEQLILEPGEREILEVTFRPDDSSVFAAELEIWSDDPDEGRRSVSLEGNRAGIAVGDPAPDFTVQLLAGGSWRLSEQRGSVVVLSYFATF